MSKVNLESAEFASEEFEDDGLDPASAAMGQTSAESPGTDDPTDIDDAAGKGKYLFTIFDAMLLVSLVCVTLATLLLFLALGEYGNIFTSYPWRSTEF